MKQKGSGAKWFPYHKGGEFRRWYGNNEYVVNWGKQWHIVKELPWIYNKKHSLLLSQGYYVVSYYIFTYFFSL